ncbi:epoxide hydrolase family protein [Winogradskya humida]|uniref:Hydrolase n=1 Tax=Winogradskya humida TaxID=113566 RepID=A0ABQ3ZG16_9ACTN|nr:epoxide hydrolase family protein [Actinoplanes humidus]GIE17453.1 hydrolase [Actinoplanes humidus]
MSGTIERFTLHVPDEDLADLHRRLAAVRWPAGSTVTDTSQGPTQDKLQALVEHWRDKYDWRACEAELNALGQYRTTIDGLDIDFLHVRSPEAGALPLIMTHGWPGSVLEFRKVIGPLTDPAAHGGDPRDAFHLVIPTLPGFGFSAKPAETGWGPGRTADAWITLMDRLGYDRWGAQGGDLGCAVTDEIARRAPAGLVGMHLNFAMFGPTPDEIADATPDEQAMLAGAKYFWDNLSGYAKQQSTRPQTIGYSLADSPVGQAAWIYALLQDTCGTPGNAEATFTLDEMLDDIMLYWLPNSGASTARMYWEMTRSNWSAPATVDSPTTVATGFTMSPKEHVRKSRRWLERRYTSIVHFDELPAGGHFTALEQPEGFTAAVRATFTHLR